MGRPRERHHVHAGLGEDRLRGTDCHAGHGLYQRGGVSKRAHGLVNAGIQRGDMGVQRVNERQVLLEEEGVVRREPAGERLAQSRPLLAEQPLRVVGQLVGIIDARAQSRQDRAAGFAHEIRDDAPELDLRQLQSLLDPLNMVAALPDQRLAQAGQIAQVPDRAGGHEARPQQATFEQLRQPLAVPDIGLAARDHLDVAGIDQHHAHPRLQPRVHGAPVTRRWIPSRPR